MNTRLLVLSLAALAGCRAAGESPAPPHLPVVRAAAVRRAEGRSLERRGEVAATARLRLGFRAPGIVRGVFVREGDAVQPGQLLAVLDDTTAGASLRDSEAAARDARTEADSTQALAASGSIAPRTVERAGTDLDRALARRDLAAQAVADTRLYAPIAGRVLARNVEPGEVTQPGGALFVIDDSRRLSVRLGLPERDVGRVHAREDVVMTPLGESAPRRLAGKVASVTPAPAPEDALYTVEVRPDGEPWQGLRPGAQVTVSFAGDGAPAVIRVPIEAVVHRRDRDLVFVVTGDAGGAVARARPVTLGWSEGAEVVVDAGLAEGDRVVTEGAYFLEDGDRVALAAGSGT